jgi:hypothetical protein
MKALALPAFFILGCQRSGTTMLRLALSAHRGVICFDEALAYRILAGLVVLPALRQRVGLKAPRISEQLLESAWIDHDLPAMRNSYAGQPILFLVRSVLDSVTSMLSLGLPGGTWLDLWGRPSLELHCSRNPQFEQVRLAAYREHRRLDRRLIDATLIWIYKNSCLLKYSSLEQLLVIRYENLVAQPRVELQRVCRHISIPWRTEVMSHHLSADSQVDRIGRAIGGTDPRRPIDTNSIDSWKRRLTPKEASLVRLMAEPLEASILRTLPTS